MRRAPALLSAVVLLATPLAGSPAHAGGEGQEVYFHDLGGKGVQEPALIHTAFNSSPYYKDLTWTGWGTRRARGTGVLDNTCGSCGGQEVIDAVLVLKRFKTCWDDTLVYKRAWARLTYDDGTTKTTKVTNVCATDYS